MLNKINVGTCIYCLKMIKIEGEETFVFENRSGVKFPYHEECYEKMKQEEALSECECFDVIQGDNYCMCYDVHRETCPYDTIKERIKCLFYGVKKNVNTNLHENESAEEAR